MSASFFSKFAVSSAILTSGALLSVPIALADSAPRKSIYDDDVSETVTPIAGTSIPTSAPVTNPTESVEDNNTSFIPTETIGGVHINTVPQLESYIKSAREWTVKRFTSAEDKVDSTFEKYLSTEKKVTKTILDLKDPKEETLAGGVYVLVSTLSGSILARNRSFPIRFLTPLIFGIGAFRFFLPGTYANTGKLIWRYEQEYPEIVQAHTTTKESIEKLVNNVEKSSEQVNEALENGVRQTRRFVAKSTGLKIPLEEEKNKRV
ncbi:hypothetical protein NADFUDRAFT_48380 [Nadsonia fulvescens var. elongata DSM 6958]|uniref:MICOS complex subunit n=1 Tax=Nadsonia fulvescens var. elongata DSM 6958 TaxID=857566 RepID=A0A1E3PQJ9_9ASCO|nr:hypothetical protein NADFUDRAFT_48380 [Nadsonia fulvescens var. elongata DSM 6958]